MDILFQVSKLRILPIKKKFANYKCLYTSKNSNTTEFNIMLLQRGLAVKTDGGLTFHT